MNWNKKGYILKEFYVCFFKIKREEKLSLEGYEIAGRLLHMSARWTSPEREACGHRAGARHAGIARARGMRALPGREACGRGQGARVMRASPGKTSVVSQRKTSVVSQRKTSIVFQGEGDIGRSPG